MVAEKDVLPALTNIPNSTNPSFLQRAVAEIEVYYPPTDPPPTSSAAARWIPPFDTLEIPLPPVVLRLYDLNWDEDDDEDDEDDDRSTSPSSRGEETTSATTQIVNNDAVKAVEEESRGDVVVKETAHEVNITTRLQRMRAAAVKLLKKEKGKLSRELIGTIVEWNATNLDQAHLESHHENPDKVGGR